MGWKGAWRSFRAEMRRVEREERRRQRELEKQQKELAKMEAVERAHHEAELYENRIALLLSVCRECGAEWDWQAISRRQVPPVPQRSRKHEDEARATLDDFTPGLADKLLRRSEAKREMLAAAVEEARELDEKEYQEALRDHNEWHEQRGVAQRMLSGDVEAFVDAINKIDPFAGIPELQDGVEVSFPDLHSSEVVVHVGDEAVVPSEEKRVLKSGKLSVRKIPKTRFYELYRHYVCGCVLRTARELMAAVPIEMAVVTAVTSMLNPSTGYIEQQPVVSAAIPRDTLVGLNFELLDASAAMGNFMHRMKFHRTKGFQATQVLHASDIRARGDAGQ